VFPSHHDPFKTSAVTGPSMGGKLAMAANKRGLEGKKVTKIETVDGEMDVKVLLLGRNARRIHVVDDGPGSI